VRLDGEVRWLLAIIARTTHAFGEEDKRAVVAIVGELERRVALLRERLLSKQLLEMSEQGVVVTNRGGRILRANRRARDLLRLSDDASRWGLLRDYAADDAARALFASEAGAERRQIRVGAAGGVGSAVLASRRDLASDAGESVWLFTDLRAEEWQHDSRFVENTIREVARQARGSLMLAASMVKRLAAQAAGNDLALRAVAELGKADLTYQRIADSLVARKEPMREARPVAVDRLIASLLQALPQREAARITCAGLHRRLIVQGDRGRLEMALSLLLAAALGRSSDTEFSVTLRRRRGELVIAILPRMRAGRGPRLKPLAPNPGDSMETAAIIMDAHRGRVQGADLESARPCLQAILPLAETGVASVSASPAAEAVYAG
jgi:PAS domain-containing protein